MSNQLDQTDNSIKPSLKRSLDDKETESVDLNDICSLQDVIDTEKERNEIANAVLGASDSTNCSYKDGYVFRQALYCCITCLKETKSNLTPDLLGLDRNFLHGICLACSYECHANHELLELYTKRNFRCDCGNSKFNTKKNECKLNPNKEKANDLNKYNHNFNGEYCTCNRPYPETSELSNSSINESKNTEENSDEMLQCTICEDWYHLNHLKRSENFPSNEDDYEEMVCQKCMENNQYLWSYQAYIALKSESLKNGNTEIQDQAIDVVNLNDNSDQTKNYEKPKCVLEGLMLKNQSLIAENIGNGCCFLNGWREALCRCEECLDLYKTNDVEFLLKSNDSIKYYEALGKEKEKESTNIDENKLIDDQLSRLNRVSRVEFLHNVNDFKTELVDFLRNFANKGEVVKRENVTQFFEDLEKRKRQKLNDNNVNVSKFYCQ